jgi:hypothetical protein
LLPGLKVGDEVVQLRLVEVVKRVAGGVDGADRIVFTCDC